MDTETLIILALALLVPACLRGGWLVAVGPARGARKPAAAASRSADLVCRDRVDAGADLEGAAHASAARRGWSARPSDQLFHWDPSVGAAVHHVASRCLAASWRSKHPRRGGSNDRQATVERALYSVHHCCPRPAAHAGPARLQRAVPAPCWFDRSDVSLWLGDSRSWSAS